MKLSIEEILLIIGLAGGVFAFITNKVMALARDLATLSEKYDSFESSKFSQEERMNKMEQKLTELDKNVAEITVHLGSIKSGIEKLENITSKIFDMMERKQDKIAV